MQYQWPPAITVLTRLLAEFTPDNQSCTVSSHLWAHSLDMLKGPAVSAAKLQGEVAYLSTQGFACGGRSVGIRADGGAGVDVISVDSVANPAADRAAVVPTEEEKRRAVLTPRPNALNVLLLAYS